MQTMCTLLQTDNHTNTSTLNFYRSDAPHDGQATVSKHWNYPAPEFTNKPLPPAKFKSAPELVVEITLCNVEAMLRFLTVLSVISCPDQPSHLSCCRNENWIFSYCDVHAENQIPSMSVFPWTPLRDFRSPKALDNIPLPILIIYPPRSR